MAARQSSDAAAHIDPRKYMLEAIEEMRESVADASRVTPAVGAAVVLPDGSVHRAHRSELRNGDHAEYTLIERRLRDRALDGARLFVTLEPCAPGARSDEKTACAQRVVDARVSEVWIGIPDPFPTVAGAGRQYLEAQGVVVHDFDPDLQQVIVAENAEFLAHAEAAARSIPLTQHQDARLDENSAKAKALLGRSEGRIPFDELVRDSTEQLRVAIEQPSPVSAVDANEYASYLATLATAAQTVVRMFALAGFWGDTSNADALVRSLHRLSQWPRLGGIVIYINARVYPALLALYAGGTAAVAAGNLQVAARLLMARVARSTEPYPQPDERLPAPFALNGPEVLDPGEIGRVLNIGAAARINYYAPVSVYVERALRPLLADLVPGDEDYQHAFDTFEALLALRYLVEGGQGLPAGSYTYRNKRSFTMQGVPERLLNELRADGAGWSPIAAGLFQDAQAAQHAIEEMQARLNATTWTSVSEL